METKSCRRCKAVFPLTAEYWHRNRASRDGYQNQCRPCQREAVYGPKVHAATLARNNAYNHRHHADRLAYAKAYYQRKVSTEEGREQHRASVRRCRLKHLDKRRASEKRYRASHEVSTDRRAYYHAYYWADPERGRAYSRAVYWRDVEHTRATRRAANARRKARSQVNTG